MSGNLPLAGLRILVVEDEVLIAMDIEECCRDGGAADVIVCTRVSELGDDPLAAPSFDAAILDVMQDGGPSLDFAARLRDRGLPFIFATGYSDSEMFAHFRDVPVVAKPFASSELLSALSKAIERSRESSSV